MVHFIDHRIFWAFPCNRFDGSNI